MWIRLRKELSVLAVTWTQALGLVLLVFLLRQRIDTPVVVVAAWWLLCFIVASRLFGAEFDERSWPRLLAQPISRSRIWCEKMGVGAVLILTGSSALWWALAKLELHRLKEIDPWSHALIPLVALATGPTVSLWLRDSLRTLWASMALPVAVYVAVVMFWTFAGAKATIPSAASILVPYCAFMLAAGYRQFMALEVIDGGAGGMRTVWKGSEVTHRPRGLMRELVLKEIRLQRTGLLLIPLAVAGWIGFWLLSFKADMRLAGGGTLGDWLAILGYVPSVVLLAVVPALLGASAVASERQLGVTGWQLGLPASCRLQWRLKLAVSVMLVLLSGLLGVALAAVRLELGALPDLIWGLGPIPLLALTAGLFGSRHARDPFQALGLALIFGAGLWYVWRLLEFASGVAVTLWPYGLGPLLHLGGLRIGGLVDVTMGLLLLALVWAVPHQEEWISGRRLGRSGLAALAAIAVIALAAQVCFFTWAAHELEREVAAKDAEIESLGDTSSLEWLLLELDLPVDELGVGNLVPIIDFGTYVALGDRQTEHQYWALRQPESRFMNLSVWVDGVPSRGLDRWYWLRARRGLLYSSYAHKNPIEGVVPIRGVATSWRAFSIAPFWLQDERRSQLDRRVRQNVILEATRTGRQLERRQLRDPQGFRRSVERGFKFLRPGMTRRAEAWATTTEGYPERSSGAH